ncbi:MAG: transposase [Pseudobutyrivibrio sp.]|nr:transposase [Pseudobutyrivibrio sp.]
MLKNTDFNYFPAVYVVCGYTDMRYGIDSLAAIIERKYKVNLFVPNTSFLFCGRQSTKIKGLL